VALLGLGMIWLVLVWLYPAEFSGGLFSEIEPEKIAISRWSLIKNVGVVLGLLVAFLAGVPVAEAAFLAACVLLFTRRVQPHLVFAEFDWGLLVFFSGLFIVSGSLESSGLTKSLFDAMSIKSDINMWTFSGLTVVLSNLVSNVPAVLLLKSVVQNMAQPEGGWLTLAAASTLAGNMTLLGSVANLIVAEIASRWRVEISFWEYTRAGFIITILSLITGLGWMQLFLWR